MFDFQCSIFDSAIFVLLFCTLKLQWLKTEVRKWLWKKLRQEVQISKHVVRLLVTMYTKPIFIIFSYLLSWSTNYGRLKVYCILSSTAKISLYISLYKIEVYNEWPLTRGRDFLPKFFSAKSSFLFFFFYFLN